MVCEVLQPGDLAVDLTAGKGRDTLALWQAVAPQGQVIAFDLQERALLQTTDFLADSEVDVVHVDGQLVEPGSPGIFLLHSCHSKLTQAIQRPVKAVIANLGYLPGGDKSLVTKAETTLSALSQSLSLLTKGGRLAVTVYPSHAGGADEACQVDRFFTHLPRQEWQVLQVKAANRNEAPYLYVSECL